MHKSVNAHARGKQKRKSPFPVADNVNGYEFVEARVPYLMASNALFAVTL